MEIQPNSRFLITRLSHIGDCVLTLPLVTALRKAYPLAHIAWAVESPSDELVARHVDLDEVIRIPRGWMKSPLKWPSIFRELKERRFDIAIDPQGITKSAALGWLSAAPVRIGIRGRWGREFSPWLNNRLQVCQRTHLLDRTLDLLQALGIDESGDFIDFGFAIDQNVSLGVDHFLQEQLFDEQADFPKREFAVINPGASWPSKRWVTERFGEVADFLFCNYGLRSVVAWAGHLERDFAAIIVENSCGAAIAAPSTSLNELAYLLSKAKFYLGCDTGPMHIATAVGTPCVGLYGPNRPEESGAYGEKHVHVQKWYQGGSSRQRRRADNLAMRDISVEDVCLACEHLLKEAGTVRS